MKKGFTLIELMIALVIIGVIMSMVIKGKQLVRVAKLKSDVYRFAKIETAVKTHLAAGKHIKVIDSAYSGGDISPFSIGPTAPNNKNNSISPFASMGNYAYIDMNPLYALGMFTQADLYMKYYQFNIPFGSKEMPQLAVIFCHPVGTETANHSSTQLRLHNLCITAAQPINGKIGNIIVDIPATINCGVEVMLDDLNVNTGRYKKGKTYSNPPGPNLTDEDYDNCENLPRKYSSNPAVGGHAGLAMAYYMVFVQ